MNCLLFFGVCLLMTGCGTIINGSSANIYIKTSPSGITAVADGKQCVTPCTLNISRKTEYIDFSKQGFLPHREKLDYSFSAWCLLTYYAMPIDYISGGMWRLPESVNASIEPLNEDAAASSINVAVFDANREKPNKSVLPKDFEKTIPKKAPTKEERVVYNNLDRIPPNWPQMYFYETDDYKYWTICGEALSAQSESVISSKNKADSVFYSEFPKSQYGDLNYETTHMDINTFDNKYKSWRIIRVTKSAIQLK